MAPKTVKRYANRKLYDTERSCYVTLDDIASMIKAGDEVRVVDNKTGEDLTNVTLAQIIFEAEKKKNFMSLDLLRDLIRNGGDSLSEFARQRVDRVQAAAQDIRESAQKIKSDLEGKLDKLTHRRGEKSEAEGGVSEHARITELVSAYHKAFADMQKSIEERVKGSVGTVSRYANVGREIEDIRQRIASLEDRLGKS